ncbi:hypothetical protein PAE61_09790 [Paracoccus aerodenitrificans]|nr:hypothetical protein [Paracoccus aerodenitrificans]WBU65710.1 hypothetical protein PAE61_09790 [Paracoccus aerodenitrificans]
MMLIVLVLVAVGGWFAYGRILPIFAANPWLNGLILTVFVIGVLACFWQVAQLFQSVSWIERFAERRRNASERGVAALGDGEDRAPRLLAPLAALLGARGPIGGVISTGSARSILDSVATRIDEARDITRYLSNLLIFLGLLGTFYGLATTVPAVVDTIRALAPQEGQTGMQVFENLMTGLEAQLGGMAVAFSSSLLGLAGSLVVGLLELFATHGQNRFYRELEEWLSGFTRLGIAGDDSDKLDQASILGFLDQIAAQMAELQAFYTERDEIREQEAIEADERVLLMARNVERLGQFMLDDSEANVSRLGEMATAMTRLSEGQQRLISAAEQGSAAGTEELTRALSRLGEAQENLIRATGQHPAESGIAQALDRLGQGQERLISIVEQNPAEMDEMARALNRLAEAQDRLIAAGGARAQDDESRIYLRSIDDAMARLVEETAAARQLSTKDLRHEIVELTEALRALGRA